jgi:hypothetical protein
VTFTVKAATAPSVDTTFDYQINGAATGVVIAAQVNDFSSTHGKVTILAGQQIGTFDVTPVTDTVNEVFEGFNVTLLDSSFIPLATSKAVVISDASYTPPTTELTVSATDVRVNNSKAPVTFIGQVGQTTTLQASDKVTGNGLNDTLRVVTDAAGTTTTGFTVTGVKTLEVQAQASGTTVLGLENVTGLTNVRTASSTNNLQLNNVNNVVDLSFQNTINAANVTVNYTDAAVVGTTDVQNIALNNNTLGTITLSNTTTAGTSHTGIETVSINTTGNSGASSLLGLATAATVLKVAGNQNLTISGLVPTLSDIEAGTLTGKLTITAGQNATNITVVGGTNDDSIDVTNAQAANVSINAGTGNDTITITDNSHLGTFTTNDSINGGDGSDTIKANLINDVNVANTFKNSSSLETLAITSVGFGTLNADSTTGTYATAAGVTTYDFTAAGLTTVTLNNVVDNVNVNVLQTAAGGQSLTLTKPAAVTAGTSNVNFSTKALDETIALSVVSDATLKINATDSDTTTLNSLNISTLTSSSRLTLISVSGNENVNLGSDLNAAGATNLATVTSTTTGAFSVDSNTATVALTVTAAGTSNTILTGTGADVINANGTQNISVNANSGNNTVNAVGGATYTTGITTGAGNDKITVTGNGTNTITTSDGDDVVTVLGTGNSTVNVGTGIDKITFTAGANQVNISAGDFTSADTIWGGSGSDTVAITNGAVNLTDGSFYNLKSVDTLSLANATNNVTVNQIANVEGLTTISLNGGTNSIYVGEGFVNPLTVNVVADGTDTITSIVNSITSAAAITVKANASYISAADAITGGSSANDNLVLTADDGIADLSGLTQFETITVAANTTTASKDITIDLNNNAVITGTLTVNSAALIDANATLTLDASDITTAAKLLNVTGGNGADTVFGTANNDTINGGAGADVLFGGNGADVLTGGAGADKFTYAALSNSSSTNTDTITDFVSASDQILIDTDLAGTLNFAGNYSSFAGAQGATLVGGTIDYVFQTDNNTLWVDLNNDGTLNANDLQIKLSGTTALTAGDVAAATVYTSRTGNAVVLSAAAANVNTGTNTNANLPTTVLDDTILSTAAHLAGSIVDGGAGNDTLTISTDFGAAFDLTDTNGGTAGAPGVSNVERINLTLGNTVGALTMPSTANLVVTNASATVGSIVTLGAGAGQSFVATGTGANTVVFGAGLGQSATITGSAGVIQTVTLGGAGQSVSTGIGNDTVNTTVARAAGSTFTLGTGTDTLAITDAGTVTLGATAVAGGAAAFSGVETVTLTGASTLNVTPTAALAVTQGNGATTVNGTGTAGLITVAANAANALSLAGTSNFAVTAAGTAAVDDTSTGTLLFTAAAGIANTITSSSASLVTLDLAAQTSAVTTFGGTSNLVVNGVGTATTGAGGFTEASTHTGAAVTTIINVAGAFVSTNTLAGALGTVTVNDAHTGTGANATVLATGALTGRTINVTLTGATGDFTVTGSNPTTITATAGAHAITGGTGADTITGFTGNDTLVGGLGADVLYLGTGGTDVVNMGAGDSSLATGVSSASGTVLNVSGINKVYNFGTGDTLTLNTGASSTTTAGAYTLVRIGATLSVATTTNDAAFLQGTYDAFAGTFTVTPAGASTLLAYDDNGVTAAGAYRGVVLVGYIDTGALDTFIAASTTGATFLSVG